MKKTILAYGELLWDLLPTGKALGGATTNFIFRINQFGDNGFLVSRIGDDENGQEAIEKLIELGLAVHHVQTDPDLPTGTVPVTLNAEGVPQFTIIRNVAYDHIVLTGDMLHLGSMADCIYFGTLSQRTEQSKNTLRTLLHKTPDAIKFLDINLRKDCYSPEIIKESLELATILKINDQELLALKEMFNLSGNSLQELSQELVSRYHLTLALVTLGEKGAFVMTNKGHYSYDPGYRVNVVDTVGAGDACSAGFMHYYLNRHSPEESLKFGNATGALVAATKGGTQVVTKEEIVRLMREKHERISI
ncbi:MAG: carbohydrate kinase [Mangrovibacterium sp.]